MNVTLLCHADGTDFWISQGAAIKPPIHIAFRVSSREAVDAFYKAAIAAGGKDNGAPGLRPHYHPNYYGAFVFDPDGHTSRPFARSSVTSIGHERTLTNSRCRRATAPAFVTRPI